jgi:8-oxo-dGTP pyrophosphatase MutT (NUDIX family)
MFVRPKKAATIAIIRDGTTGTEVLMMKRGPGDRFLPSNYVFPGGAVDEQDSYAGYAASGIYPGVTIPGERENLLTHLSAGIREVFEESGILLACDANGLFPESDESKFYKYREQVFRGTLKFSDLLKNLRLTPWFAGLYYLERWITPFFLPIRYDARFFAAMCPKNQHVSHDGNELVETLWINPREALRLHRAGKMKMVLPTSKTLQFLSSFTSADELFTDLEQKERNSPLRNF